MLRLPPLRRLSSRCENSSVDSAAVARGMRPGGVKGCGERGVPYGKRFAYRGSGILQHALKHLSEAGELIFGCERNSMGVGGMGMGTGRPVGPGRGLVVQRVR